MIYVSVGIKNSKPLHTHNVQRIKTVSGGNDHKEKETCTFVLV